MEGGTSEIVPARSVTQFGTTVGRKMRGGARRCLSKSNIHSLALECLDCVSSSRLGKERALSVLRREQSTKTMGDERCDIDVRGMLQSTPHLLSRVFHCSQD